MTERKRINPLFKNDQILTIEKWAKLQKALDDQHSLSPEQMELLRIRSKLEWRQKKIATIEAAVLIETLLRDYGMTIMRRSGITESRLKTLKDEMTFNTLINIILPLSLSDRNRKKLDVHIRAIDNLRRIRNDIVHGNIDESQIDEASVRKGIDSSLIVVEAL